MITIRTGDGRVRKVFYVCNRKRCEHCAKECRHTTDEAFALYDEHTDFAMVRDDKMGEVSWWEKVRHG